jgi:glycosyltransferase involved in cell wall biosynthesis
LRGLRTHVLTLASNRATIEEELQRRPIANLSFSYVEPRWKRLKEGHGDHYLAWQFSALKVARGLHRADPFDVIHHVTYGSIQVPSQLWRLGVPVVFGPVGGGQTSPRSMRSYFGRSQKTEMLRTAMTRLLRYSPIHRRWLGRMAIVLTTNEETRLLAGQLGRKDAVLCLDPGLPGAFFADGPRQFQKHSGPLRLLWTGRVLPRKGLPLTLDAITETHADVELTILGNSYSPNEVREMIAEKGLEEKVFWSGEFLPWDEVRRAYLEHDAFLFTSLRDSCAAQLLEAMALGLPIITLDLHGAHTMVPSEAGIKVQVTGRLETVDRIARAIERFATSSIEERNAMSAAGWNAACKLAWNERAERIEELYRRVIEPHSVRRDRHPAAYQVNISDLPTI